jgi:hypothetical protein
MALDVMPFEDGYRVEMHARAEQARLGLLPFSGDPKEIPPTDLELDLTGIGRSLHALAASANGRLRVVQGSGKVDKSALTRMFPEVSTIHGTLSPSDREEAYATLECGVYVAEIENGIVQLGPLAMRTDRMVAVGSGEIDLGTEELSVHCAAMPRRGIGLSASTITNSYIKLGGSLSEPELSLSPLKAARDTGAAVLTGGLSILGRAVFNRVSAETNLCLRALKIDEKREEKKKRGH